MDMSLDTHQNLADQHDTSSAIDPFEEFLFRLKMYDEEASPEFQRDLDILTTYLETQEVYNRNGCRRIHQLPNLDQLDQEREADEEPWENGWS